MTARWDGCYRQKFDASTLTRESLSHPARMAKRLTERIFEYGEKKGYWQPGDLILDFFFGIGTTGIVGAYRGYRILGIELEQFFIDLFDGCDCTGVTREDWLRFYWRPRAGAYTEERHICPACQAEMLKVNEDTHPTLFDLPSANYLRETFKVPIRPPHRYRGNRDLNLRKWQDLGVPIPQVIKGDSRRLVQLLTEWVAGGVVSPPFAGNTGGHGSASRDPVNAKYPGVFERHLGSMANEAAYGSEAGQIGAMPTGEPPTATVAGGLTSPSYANVQFNADQRQAQDKDNPLMTMHQTYGETEGQMGVMPEGDLPAIIKGGITSPAYGDTDVASKADKGTYGGDFARTGQSPRALGQMASERYGGAEGQMGMMPLGDISLANTYWGALAEVYGQALQVFKEGGVLAVVTKNFVRDGVVVDLTGQMLTLFTALGWEFLGEIHAMLVKETVRGRDIYTGEDIVEIKEYKSFFRHIQETRNPNARIDWESVLFVRKPLSQNDGAGG